MSFSVVSDSNDKEDIEVTSYTYDDYTKLVNPVDGSEDIYFKSALIYSSEQLDNSTIRTYYSPKGEYTDVIDNTLKTREVSFTDINNIDSENARLLEFYHYSKLYNNNPNIINFLKFSKAHKKYKNITDSVIIRINDKSILDPQDEIVKEFDKLEHICQTLSFTIPYLIASNEIENVITEINSYIVSGNMDVSVIETSMQALKECEFCEASYKVLEQIVANKNVDYRDALYKLNSYLRNIETIIEINSKDCELFEEI